jgi:phytoene synthase
VPSTSPAQLDTSADSYIRDLVRRGDQDRYWSALLAPEAARPHLLALFAFNIELSRIAEQVSEPQLGEIRLQWWRDALPAALTGGPADHPVLARLAKAAAAHRLPHEPFLAMIDAHGFDVHGEPMPDAGALQDYLAATAGSVFSLGAQILGAGELREASALAAGAYGLAGLLRALPYHASRGRIFLPADLLARHGLHPNVILHGSDNADLRAALRALSREAADMLARFRGAAAALPRQALPAFLPLALVEPTLKKLAAPDHHPLRTVIQLNPIIRYGLIWRAFLRGRI